MSSLFIRTEAGTSSQAGRQTRELAGSEAIAFLNELHGLDQVKAELNRLLSCHARRRPGSFRSGH
jgi:hypothetical protein